eukprot:3429407-Prymnesium_polylepis.1
MMVSQPSQRIHHIGARSRRKWESWHFPPCASSCLVVRSCVRSCVPTSAGCPYVNVVAELQTCRFTEQHCCVDSLLLVALVAAVRRSRVSLLCSPRVSCSLSGPRAPASFCAALNLQC